MSLTLNPQVSRLRPLFDYIKKQQENRKFIKSVEITATFFLITFFLLFALRPTILTISALKGDIESKKILKEELRKKINQIIVAQDLFSQVQERYQIVNAGLPDRPNYYEAAAIIQQLSEKNSSPTDSVSFNLDDNPVKDEPNLKTYTISLGINGSFLNAMALATDILSSRRTDYISTISFASGISKSEDASPSANQGVNTKFFTEYYYWPTYDEKK